MMRANLMLSLALSLMLVVLVTPPLRAATPMLLQEGAEDSLPNYEACKIYHLVMEAPGPLARTTIGIGEQLRCWVNPNDVFGDEEGPDCEVLWDLGGLDQGTLSDWGGTVTTYWSYIYFEDYHDVVKVKIFPLIGDSAEAELDVSVIIPTGVTYKFLGNDDTVGQAGNQYIGGGAFFECWITPTTVNFDNVCFQENVPQKVINWPNLTVDTLTAFARDIEVTVDDNNKPNYYGDYLGGVFPIGKINGQAWAWSRAVPLEFMTGSGSWRVPDSVISPFRVKPVRFPAGNINGSPWRGHWGPR
jgi:hypothetical protein